jgi:hypothetical protein
LKSRSGFVDNVAFSSRAGSIDSLAARELTLAGFVYVARLPPAPFPPRLEISFGFLRFSDLTN